MQALCLTPLTQHDVLKLRPHCSMCEGFILFLAEPYPIASTVPAFELALLSWENMASWA